MLKFLEINGFKSFGKPAKFEFSPCVTAIVGPNGAGKSNIVEAIKWVLGEQSLKDLRSKKGSDLIYHGHGSAGSQSSRAKVLLTLKNNSGEKLNPRAEIFDGETDVVFEELAIGREIWRDGLSEYSINGSSARLKDIGEILSKMGLGRTQHFIINQGETGRVLYVSSLERREMIEDALGLNIYRLKEEESRRKLEETEKNIERAGIMRQELKPHLSFLEKQVKRFEKIGELKEKIKNILNAYLVKEKIYLERKLKTLEEQKKPLEEKLKTLEEKHKDFFRQFADKKPEKNEKETEYENKLKEIYEKRMILERDLGRLEGIISFQPDEKESAKNNISKEELMDLLLRLKTTILVILKAEEIENAKMAAKDALETIESFIKTAQEKPAFKNSDSEELLKEKNRLNQLFEKLEEEKKEARKEFAKFKEAQKIALGERDNLESVFWESEKEREELKEKLNEIKLEKEKFNFEFAEYEKEKDSAKIFIGESAIDENFEKSTFENETERLELRKEIARLKFRIEETGGIDETALNEYNELKSRDSLLEKELKDLEGAGGKLDKISRELKERIAKDFEAGLKSMNGEFQRFFEIIFGGGKAALFLEKIQTEKEKDEFEEDDDRIKTQTEPKTGVSISINLPRKKIRSLEMLSGGEKALVSLAFLLAVSSVNPPPFIVIDEADAALDETNSLRFAKLLKEVANKIQFIVITHNRQTMTVSETLYGITMGKDGISKILSLKLEESQKMSKI